MMPGMGRMNPRQMKQMMKRLGMNMDEVGDIEEVIIKAKDKDIIIHNPSVTIMDIKGQKSYQISGDEEVIMKDGAGPSIPQEDIDLVAAQANVSEEEAKAALKECDGNPAEAIIKLMSG